MKPVTALKYSHQIAISSVEEPVRQLVTSKFDYELTFNIQLASPANESIWQMLPISLSSAVEFDYCSVCNSFCPAISHTW